MKRFFKYLFLLQAAVLLTAACGKSAEEEFPGNRGSLEKTFRASMPSTKVAVDGSHRAIWEAGDDISVEGARFTLESPGSASAVFRGTVAEDKDNYLAILPWTDAYVFGERTVSGTLPNRQPANEGGCSWPLAYAWSEGSSLHFHHLSCVLQFTLGADMTDVKEVVLRGNAGEVLAGDFSLSLTAGGDVSSFASGASTATSVSLYGTLEANKTYCINVLGLGTVFSSGLTLEFLFDDGSAAYITKATPISLPRNNWINLSNGITKSSLTPVSKGIASLSDWRSFKTALEASSDISSWCWNGEVLIKSDIAGLTASDALTNLDVPLNGDGHTLSFTGTSALIETLSADVHDLNIAGSIVFKANSNVGALAAVAETGVTISNVSSSFDISAGALGSTTSLRIGGLVGLVSGDSGKLTFTDCSVTGDITSFNYANSIGGIIAHGGGGSSPEVVIDNCLFDGKISYTQGACPYDFNDGQDKDRSAGRVGGLIGDASRIVTIRNSSTGASSSIDAYLYGMTLGNGGIGGLVGRTTQSAKGYTMQVTFEGTNTNNADITIHDALDSQHALCGQVIGSITKDPSGSGTASGSLSFASTPAASTVTSGRFSLCQISSRRKITSKTSLDGTRTSNTAHYMSYLLVTSTGKVIVIDGGFAEEAPTLKAYIRNFGGHVDAWYITHPHQDHYEALSTILADPEEITIGTVYHSRASEARYAVPGELATFYERLDAFGGTVVDIRTPLGRYDIGGIGIKVLSVCDEGLSTDLNNSSVILRVWDDVKSVVFLGDCGILEGRKLLATYPDDLNCDYLQIAHHGNKGCEQVFYNTVSFNYALVPTAEWIWRADLYYSDMPDNLDGGVTRGWIEGLLVPSHIITSFENNDWWFDYLGSGYGGTLDGFTPNDSDYFN